jgi:hypothetical protein
LNNSYVKAYVNAAAVFIEESRWEEADKSCKIALDIESGNQLAEKNLAHVLLARHEWEKGWKHWEMTLGSKYRKEWVYGDEGRWDGSKGQNIVIYGDQGLGDEINYASCIPDAIADSKHVIIDCDPRLENLYRRSFPQAEVHGTRRDDKPEWLEDAVIDARVSVASLPMYYRNSDESFPGTPYLTPDPEMVKMWKSLFAEWKKPVYGLCLHGGGKLTGETWRKLRVEDISSLLKLDAEFISLDYKGSLDNPRIREYKWATQATDYDLTAALIASLDAVIGVNTTAMHCAHAVGVQTHILVSGKHQWRYEPDKNGNYVWCKKTKLYHQGKGEPWRKVVERVKL